jgi:hypothetical protein
VGAGRRWSGITEVVAWWKQRNEDAGRGYCTPDYVRKRETLYSGLYVDTRIATMTNGVVQKRDEHKHVGQQVIYFRTDLLDLMYSAQESTLPGIITKTSLPILLLLLNRGWTQH